MKDYLHGRGAQINTPNKFDAQYITEIPHSWKEEDEIDALKRTQFIMTHPKTVINKVDSPDIGMNYSMNPYQGCEHGCIYCYARNSHTYWGYSAGIDFEQKILVKKEAPEMLRQQLKKKNWIPLPVMLSGNTDCYQPAEKKFKITRQLLEILWDYRHPVGLITKNSLILRDLDILEKMAKEKLVRVAISITTLNEALRKKLEPRTATGKKRIEVVRRLTEIGVPVNIMMAPIIPSLNDTEIFDIAEAAADAGALALNHTIVRLNGDVSTIFKDWLAKAFPDKYERVIHQIEHCHGGQLNDSRFGKRMSGEGNIAEIINKQIKLAREKYFKDRVIPPYDIQRFHQMKNPQLSLF